MSAEIVSINEALKSENASLKQVIEQTSYERDAWRQTSGELLQANVGLKAAYNSFENQLKMHQGIIGDKNKEISEKDKEIEDLKFKINPLNSSDAA